MLPDDDYLAALGRAMYCVAYTEWLVIEVVTRLDSGATLAGLAAMTTGQLADRFVSAVDRAQLEPGLKDRLGTVASAWKSLVPLRNDVAHARPATDPQKRQRLYRWAPGVRPKFVDEEFLAELGSMSLDIGARLSPLRSYLPAKTWN